MDGLQTTEMLSAMSTYLINLVCWSTMGHATEYTSS